MDTIKFYYFYLESQFLGFPLIIRIAAAIVGFLIVFYIGSVIRFLIIARGQKRKEKLDKKIVDRFEEKLKDILFSQGILSRVAIIEKLEFKQGSLKNKEKEAVTEELLSIVKTEGHAFNEYNYTEVVDIFGLIAYWEGLLRKDDLKKNKLALRKLEDLAINIRGNLVAHKVQGRNQGLRKHAKSDYMRYAAHDAFKFLEEDFDKDFNALDEMRIHDSLEELAKQNPVPLLIRLVYTAQSESYRCFLIKEIGFFNQRESGAQLVEMYQEEKSHKVKAQIVVTLGLLQYRDAMDVLINDYELNLTSTQACIIEAMGNMDSPKALFFLEDIFKQTQDGNLQIKIVENIYKLDKTKSVFNKMKQNAQEAELKHTAVEGETRSDFVTSIFLYVEQENEKAKSKVEEPYRLVDTMSDKMKEMMDEEMMDDDMIDTDNEKAVNELMNEVRNKVAL